MKPVDLLRAVLLTMGTMWSIQYQLIADLGKTAYTTITLGTNVYYIEIEQLIGAVQDEGKKDDTA